MTGPLEKVSDTKPAGALNRQKTQEPNVLFHPLFSSLKVQTLRGPDFVGASLFFGAGGVPWCREDSVGRGAKFGCEIRRRCAIVWAGDEVIVDTGDV